MYKDIGIYNSEILSSTYRNFIKFEDNFESDFKFSAYF